MEKLHLFVPCRTKSSEEPLKRIAGKLVRLRLVMKAADLFSLRFR